MERMNGETLNILEDNIQKLKAIFPEVFNEDKVDFEKLEAVLGEYKDNGTERYNFSWPGKSNAIRIAQTPSTGTLRPCKDESKNWDETQNLYIEGDNLEVLKILQKSYYGKVKMIYIDPPYNTGNDFVYKDDFKDNVENYLAITGQKDEDGKKTTTNTESNGRYHSNWLNMMYPRLKLARNLLKDDGVIFISIDDNEVTNLKKICDEIFGEDNLVSIIPWQARQSIQNDTDLSSSHEYIVSYAKNRRKEHRRLKESNMNIWYDMESFACYPLPLDKDKFSNEDKDSRGLWKADPFDAPNVRPNLTYAIVNPNTGEEFWPPKGRCWRTDEDSYKKLLRDNRIVFGKSGESKPQLKVFYEEKKKFGSVDNTWFTGEKCGTATQGTKELQQLFKGPAYFDTPKPTKLILKLMQLSLGQSSNEIVLDFFSGSATTADAVIQYNNFTSSKCKYIMVQIPESVNEKSIAYNDGFTNICEIAKKRVRKAGEQYDNKSLDNGFKVFKLDSSNINKWDLKDGEDIERKLYEMTENIKEGRTEEDILYEILLKYGIDLNMPIEEHSICGKKVFDIGFGAIIACLDNNITLDAVEGIGKLKEELSPEENECRVVFMDSGFATDSVKTNAIQILKRYNIEDVKSI